MTAQEQIEYLATKEKWLPAKGFEGRYQVSDHGNVRSLLKGNGHGLSDIPKDMKIQTNPNGYRYLTLRRNGKSYTRKVSRLVAKAFVAGDQRLTVNHKDGNTSNDYASNLEWLTQGDNNRHAYRNQLKMPIQGEASPHSKLTADHVREIRHIHLSGFGIRKVARMFGVSHSTISKIISRNDWKHV